MPSSNHWWTRQTCRTWTRGSLSSIRRRGSRRSHLLAGRWSWTVALQDCMWCSRSARSFSMGHLHKRLIHLCNWEKYRWHCHLCLAFQHRTCLPSGCRLLLSRHKREDHLGFPKKRKIRCLCICLRLGDTARRSWKWIFGSTPCLCMFQLVGYRYLIV